MSVTADTSRWFKSASLADAAMMSISSYLDWTLMISVIIKLFGYFKKMITA